MEFRYNLVFLGDYVDRGEWCVEVFSYLLCLKLSYPKNVVMLRGNHETRSMTESFTFRNECLDKFDEEVYENFIDCFEALPIAVEIDKTYLCVHGGISPKLHKTSDIDKINRFREPAFEGLLVDLLWSDPVESDVRARKVKFVVNKPRQCSFEFGLSPVKEILKENNYLSIIRAHQVQVDGYNMHRWGGQKAFPSVITVFSAPNYCGTYGNKGACICIENGKMSIKQFRDVDHPYHLPNNFDLFQWSIPYLTSKIMDIVKDANKKSAGI